MYIRPKLGSYGGLANSWGMPVDAEHYLPKQPQQNVTADDAAIYLAKGDFNVAPPAAKVYWSKFGPFASKQPLYSDSYALAQRVQPIKITRPRIEKDCPLDYDNYGPTPDLEEGDVSLVSSAFGNFEMPSLSKMLLIGLLGVVLFRCCKK